ncbi:MULTISPECIES: hypothetical protein [Pseudoalteromonas]|uniref:hypothetical protein n=1 Tax=Pseudoalteromonas TaxID=53246 RepID=UPI0013FD8AED|nr:MULTISPECIES: hypothetical protein [Pseudoalteromonas]
MLKPDIGLMFEEDLSDEIFKEFENSVKTDGLNLLVESKEPSGPMMCSEWHVIPVVLAFIGKSYFDGFLKEMGKDHYQFFKESLSSLSNKVMDPPRIEPTLMGTKGKLSTNNPFSLAFAIHAETNDGFTFKLLIPKSSIHCSYDLITIKFMEFIEDYHLGIKDLNSIGFVNPHPLPPKGLIFVHYNIEANSIEWLNEKDYR